ncbi:acyltransferase, partial [Loktanella sp. TSTF-M6]
MNFTGYRRDIDGLRTLAVVPVVLGHAGLGLFAGGFVGVDVFFVISGFLITGILVRELEQGRFSLIDFYERRARRILPALFVVLAACIVVFWFLLLPQHYVVIGKAGIASLLFSSNIYFFRIDSAYFANATSMQPLLHTWSLAVEEQFYIVFPVLLWLIAAWRRTSRTLLIAGLSLASFALAVWMVPRHPVAAFYLTPTRVWELGLGALLALGAFPALRHRLLAELVAAAGLVAIAWAVFTLDKTDPFPGLNALAPCLGAVAIIWAGQSQITLTGRLLSTRGMVGIGLMSYSLYLVHWPVLVAARILTSARGNLDP